MNFLPQGYFWGKIGKNLPVSWDFLQFVLDFLILVGYNRLAQFRMIH